MAVNLFCESIGFVSHNETTINPFSECFVPYSVGDHKELDEVLLSAKQSIRQPLRNPMQSNSNFMRAYVSFESDCSSEVTYGFYKNNFHECI